MHSMTTVNRSALHDMLRGTLDPANPLSALRANPLVWVNIFKYVDQWYLDHIDTKSIAYSCKLMHDYYVASRHLLNVENFPKRTVTFPPATSININMMPFDPYDKFRTLPKSLQKYNSIINICMQDTFPGPPGQRIAYLTIQEGHVRVGESQRRSGLHIERPGAIIDSSGEKDKPWMTRTFGDGYFADVPIDGIFMASTIANSCKVWPALITNPEEVTDLHGGIEPLRDYLDEGYALAANELCWITDRTPHESLPLAASPDDPTATHVYRQFFRLVVGPLSVWYSKLNTPNPLGILPNAPISDADKFVSQSLP